MLNNIKKIIENSGYNRLTVNVENLYLYYMIKQNNMYIISLVNLFQGNEFSSQQYSYILEQVKEKFSQTGSISVLNIFYTQSTDIVREFASSEGSNWIIDKDSNKLIVYENQNNYYQELRVKIEDYLFYGEDALRSSYTTDIKSKKGVLKKYFTLCNSIIIILNVLVFIIVEITGSSESTFHMLSFGALNWELVTRDGQYFRLLTSMFLHFGADHLVNNMLVLAFVGDNLERAVGKVKYLIIYFGSGILAGLVSLGYNMFNGYNTVSAGASGAIFGVVGAMVYIVAINRGRLEEISSRQLVLFVVFSFYGGLTSQGIDNAAHIGGFIAGVLLSILLYRKPRKREVYSG